jgi:uncharacterized lipoprotein NlpE involved in copper resistance
MKRVLASIVLAGSLLGCANQKPVQAPAPGYTSTTDQTLGQSLAAVNAFVQQEKVNYASLSPSQQSVEKPYLNTLIDATNIANATYVAFHQGSATLQQAQTAFNTAENAQQALTANKGVK